MVSRPVLVQTRDDFLFYNDRTALRSFSEKTKKGLTSHLRPLHEMTSQYIIIIIIIIGYINSLPLDMAYLLLKTES